MSDTTYKVIREAVEDWRIRFNDVHDDPIIFIMFPDDIHSVTEMQLGNEMYTILASRFENYHMYMGITSVSWATHLTRAKKLENTQLHSIPSILFALRMTTDQTHRRAASTLRAALKYLSKQSLLTPIPCN